MRTWPRLGFVMTRRTWAASAEAMPFEQIVSFDAEGFTLYLPRIALPKTPSPA